MIQAQIYVYIEPLMPFTTRIKYLTDSSDEAVYCKMVDFYETLKRNYKFGRPAIDEIDEKLKCGTRVIIDLTNEGVFRVDDEFALIGKNVIRDSRPEAQSSFSKISERIEKIVKNNYFSE